MHSRQSSIRIFRCILLSEQPSLLVFKWTGTTHLRRQISLHILGTLRMSYFLYNNKHRYTEASKKSYRSQWIDIDLIRPFFRLVVLNIFTLFFHNMPHARLEPIVISFAGTPKLRTIESGFDSVNISSLSYATLWPLSAVDNYLTPDTIETPLITASH